MLKSRVYFLHERREHLDSQHVRYERVDGHQLEEEKYSRDHRHYVRALEVVQEVLENEKNEGDGVRTVRLKIPQAYRFDAMFVQREC